MAKPEEACPKCGQPGRQVARNTVQRLTHAVDWDEVGVCSARFCATSTCDVVYFDRRGTVVRVGEMAVPVYEKQSDPERLVCYCFGYSVAAVQAATRPDKSNEILATITTACRDGRANCEEKNPRGGCCLGNVRSLIRSSATGPD